MYLILFFLISFICSNDKQSNWLSLDTQALQVTLKKHKSNTDPLSKNNAVLDNKRIYSNFPYFTSEKRIKESLTPNKKFWLYYFPLNSWRYGKQYLDNIPLNEDNFNSDYKNIIGHKKYPHKDIEIIIDKNEKNENCIALNYKIKHPICYMFQHRVGGHEIYGDLKKIAELYPVVAVQEDNKITLTSFNRETTFDAVVYNAKYIHLTSDGSYIIYYRNNKVQFSSLLDTSFVDLNVYINAFLRKYDNIESGEKRYFFCGQKKILFTRKNAEFSDSISCIDNPAVIITKVTSDDEKSNEKKVEYICFDFENKRWHSLNTFKIEQFNNKQAPITQKTFSSNYLTSPPIKSYDLYERLFLYKQVKDNFKKMAQIKQELDKTEKLILYNHSVKQNFINEAFKQCHGTKI